MLNTKIRPLSNKVKTKHEKKFTTWNVYSAVEIITVYSIGNVLMAHPDLH